MREVCGVQGSQGHEGGRAVKDEECKDKVGRVDLGEGWLKDERDYYNKIITFDCNSIFIQTILGI